MSKLMQLENEVRDVANIIISRVRNSESGLLAQIAAEMKNLKIKMSPTAIENSITLDVTLIRHAVDSASFSDENMEQLIQKIDTHSVTLDCIRASSIERYANDTHLEMNLNTFDSIGKLFSNNDDIFYY